MIDVGDRFQSVPVPAQVQGPSEWTGQPGVGPIWVVPTAPKYLITGPDMPCIPPAPLYITERPIFVPGQGYITTATSATAANPVPSVAP